MYMEAAREEAKQVDTLVATIARETEASLRAQFIIDIVRWTSLKNRPFDPLPLAVSEPDTRGVYATGINCIVKKSLMAGAGRGLFANRVLKKGCVIEFFDGRVVDATSVKTYQRDSKAFCTHCITLSRNLWVLDCTATHPSAVQYMKGASFANSTSACNARVVVKEDRRGLTVVAFLVAKQDIQKGDEITFNYWLGG
jgi:hypothetical protein